MPAWGSLSLQTKSEEAGITDLFKGATGVQPNLHHFGFFSEEPLPSSVEQPRIELGSAKFPMSPSFTCVAEDRLSGGLFAP